MARLIQPRSIALTLAATLFASGADAQSAPSATPPAASAEAAKPVLSLDTPLEQIAADPAGRAVLEKDMPLLLRSDRWADFKAMSLNQLATALNGRIPAERIKRVEQDLAALAK